MFSDATSADWLIGGGPIGRGRSRGLVELNGVACCLLPKRRRADAIRFRRHSPDGVWMCRSALDIADLCGASGKVFQARRMASVSHPRQMGRAIRMFRAHGRMSPGIAGKLRQRWWSTYRRAWPCSRSRARSMAGRRPKSERRRRVGVKRSARPRRFLGVVLY